MLLMVVEGLRNAEAKVVSIPAYRKRGNAKEHVDVRISKRKRDKSVDAVAEVIGAKRTRDDDEDSVDETRGDEWIDNDLIESMSWASFKFDPKAWVRVLRKAGVDKTACQELMLLTQNDKPAGMKVIGKFLKRTSDGEKFDRPSAFIHTCVKHENETRGYWW
jgi:hypothetical protein